MKGITSPKEVDCNRSPSSAQFESGSAAQSGEIPCTAGLLSPYNPVDPGTCTTNPAYRWTFAVIPTTCKTPLQYLHYVRDSFCRNSFCCLFTDALCASSGVTSALSELGVHRSTALIPAYTITKEQTWWQSLKKTNKKTPKLHSNLSLLKGLQGGLCCKRERDETEKTCFPGQEHIKGLC